MVKYQGRSKHTVKLKNKPTKQGYKIWAGGLIDDWLFHSRCDGPETVYKKSEAFDRAGAVGEDPEKVTLAPTFALILRFAQRLRARYPDRIFCYFLDNLFLNVDVAQCLLQMRFACMGTTRKNAAGVPQWLINVKKHNRGLV
jgi:Transposase IS4